MEVEGVRSGAAFDSVKADNVVVHIFNPDPAGKALLAVFLNGLNVEDQAADVAEEFLSNEFEVVLLPAKSFFVDEDHVDEAHAVILHAVEARHRTLDAGQQAGLGARHRQSFPVLSLDELCKKVAIA